MGIYALGVIVNIIWIGISLIFDDDYNIENFTDFAIVLFLVYTSWLLLVASLVRELVGEG